MEQSKTKLNSFFNKLEEEYICGIFKKLSGEIYKNYQRLLKKREQWAENKYFIGFLGITSSGKSTLINALLRDELLPEAFTPSTAIGTFCSKGPKREAVIKYKDGSKKVLGDKNLNSCELKSYLDQKKINNKENNRQISEVVVKTPKLELDDNFVIIDTPGLDSFYEEHERITINILMQYVDIVVFNINLKKFDRRKVMDYLMDKIIPADVHIAFALNFRESIEAHPDDQRTKQENIRRIVQEVEETINEAMEGRQVKVIATDARNAKLHDLSDKEYNKTGVPELLNFFNDNKKSITERIYQVRINYVKNEIKKLHSMVEPEIEGCNNREKEKNRLNKIQHKIKREKQELRKFKKEFFQKTRRMKKEKYITEKRIEALRSRCKKLKIKLIDFQDSQKVKMDKFNSALGINKTCRLKEISDTVKSIKIPMKTEEKEIDKDGIINYFLRGIGFTRKKKVSFKKIDKGKLNKKVIEYIDNFVEKIENHWQENYSKIKKQYNDLFGKIKSEKLVLKQAENLSKKDTKTLIKVTEELEKEINDIGAIIPEQEENAEKPVTEYKTPQKRFEAKKEMETIHELFKNFYKIAKKYNLIALTEIVAEYFNEVPENIVVLYPDENDKGSIDNRVFSPWRQKDSGNGFDFSLKYVADEELVPKKYLTPKTVFVRPLYFGSVGSETNRLTERCESYKKLKENNSKLLLVSDPLMDSPEEKIADLLTAYEEFCSRIFPESEPFSIPVLFTNDWYEGVHHGFLNDIFLLLNNTISEGKENSKKHLAKSLKNILNQYTLKLDIIKSILDWLKERDYTNE